MRKNSVLSGLSSILHPVIQADTPSKQCSNFSRDSFLAFETDKDNLNIIGIKRVVYVEIGHDSAEWCGV